MTNAIAILLAAMGFGVLSVGIYYPLQVNTSTIIKIIFFLLLFIDSILYFIATWAVLKKIKKATPWIIALLVVNIVGLVFDDFGLVDAVVALYNAIILGILIVRKN